MMKRSLFGNTMIVTQALVFTESINAIMYLSVGLTLPMKSIM